MLKMRIAAMLAVFLAGAGHGTLVCDPLFQMWNSKCYLAGDNKMTPGSFESDELYCNGLDAILVSIHSKEENDYVAKFFDTIHIGLHNKSNILQWTDGSPVDYVNYAPGVADHPIENVVMVKGMWYNSNSSVTTQGYVCKKKSVEVPETPANVCPSADIVYSNSRPIYSPGYPGYYEPGLVCTYRLKVMEGFRVVAGLKKPDVNSGNRFQVYEGWTATQDKLLLDTNFNDNAISTISSNLMLIVFRGQEAGFYRIRYYGDFVPTINPLRTPTPFSPTSNCPVQNVFPHGADLTSPEFPFAYEPNTNCVYFFRNANETAHWEIHVLDLDLGRDDYINFIDLRTGEVFATTKLNVAEGTEIETDFDVGVNFRSGSTQEQFARWRLFVTGIDGHL